MIIMLMGLLSILLIASLVIAIVFSKGKFRIYIIAFTSAILLAWSSVFVMYRADLIDEDEETAEYYITKGDVFSGIRYGGNVDGYEVVRFTGLSDEDPYAVPQDLVEVSGFCKIYKSVKLYSEHNKSIISGGENSQVRLSDGMVAYYSENIVMIKPDYSDLVFYSAFFGILLVLIHSIVCAIIVLNKRSKAKKQNIV